MFEYLDYVYVVETNWKHDAVRIFADEKFANITAKLLMCLFPQSIIDVYRIPVTKSCEIIRQNDSVKLIFRTMED